MLTKHGVSLDIKSAFQSAVKNNDSTRLRYLVENFRVEISRAFSAISLNNFMISASHSGYIDIIGILLDAGVNVNCVSTAKKTPLMVAENVEVINFLVHKGADVCMNSTKHDWMYSPLSYVLSKNNYHYDYTETVKIVEALLKHGAPVNEDSPSGSPLMNAILSEANLNIVKLLLDHGADLSVRDSKGNTVLLIAAENESTENINYLLQHREVREIINVRNHQGLTALMISTRKFNHPAVKALIDHGADVNIKDVAGNTALLLAVYWHRQSLETLTTLIDADSDVNCQNGSGHSPLMLTALASWTDALILLVDSGAEVNAVSGKNETALSLTLKKFNPRPSCVKYLLDHGADASFVKPEFIIRLILRRKLVFIPRRMRCGLGPTEISSLTYLLSAPVTTVSPLFMALMTGNVKLAAYFVENLFVTKSDMFKLIHNKDVRQHLQKHKLHKCLGFLDKQAAQPLSLFSLAFIAVQSAISAAPGREERVSSLPLPQIIKDILMFKVESRPLDMSASHAEMTAYGNIVEEIETTGGLFSDNDDYDYDCYAYTSYYKSASSYSDDSEDDSGDGSDVESSDDSEVYSDDDYLDF
ncbi:unnamed protein product [Candidula unifasciata]|uniref:Ankyrin repeat protein n=1 Tax=Candidula unifasciata TaxID=100452 RepID=A0A8S4A914_9EUPU|nr:unnamed protein product [Candidula unifasciata]